LENNIKFDIRQLWCVFVTKLPWNQVQSFAALHDTNLLVLQGQAVL